MTDLLPCPFCGGEAFIDAVDVLIRIGCHNCGYSRAFPGVITATKHGSPISTPESVTLLYYNKDADEEAASSWNRRAQTENEPLTLDEMNALDHEPIYVLHTGGKWTMNGWHIATASSYQNHGRCDLEIDNGNTIIDMQNYGNTWLAYRRKPERSEG